MKPRQQGSQLKISLQGPYKSNGGMSGNMEDIEIIEEPKIKKNNNIRDIRSLKQLEKVNLDFDSPKLRKAMDEFGVTEDDCQKL